MLVAAVRNGYFAHALFSLLCLKGRSHSTLQIGEGIDPKKKDQIVKLEWWGSQEVEQALFASSLLNVWTIATENLL